MNASLGLLCSVAVGPVLNTVVSLCVNRSLAQGQVGGGSEQPNPLEDVPAHCGGVGLDDLWRSLPTQTVLGFCSMAV